MSSELSSLFTVTAVKSNPLYSVIVTTEVLGVDNPDNTLERVYHLRKSNKLLNILKAAPAVLDHLPKLNHNVVLDLYPEVYEYAFGPFVDANSNEFALVYLLYTNRINQDNHLRVVYANRFLLEATTGVLQTFSDTLKDNVAYMQSIASMSVLTDKLSQNCYYSLYQVTGDDRRKAKQIYNARAVSDFSYNRLRENFTVNITTITNGAMNAMRFLYEIHVEGAPLGKDYVVYPLNGRKGDLNISNLAKRNVVDTDAAKREEARVKYGVDVEKLEELYGKKYGFDRFRGIYTYEGKAVSPSMRGRRYIKMIKSGTDEQFTVYLPRALMAVKYNRVLDSGEEVDHINRDHTDDRIENLRVVPKVVNAAHDAIRCERDPGVCCVCSAAVQFDDKEYSYLRLNPQSPSVCSDKCRGIWSGYSYEQKAEGLKKRVLNHRYYMVNKHTYEREYFQTKNYDEARVILARDGESALSKVRPA